MGAQSKLLLPVDGVAMIRNVSQQCQAAIDGPILVVLGHEAHLVEEALDGTSVDTIFNSNFAAGQFTSVAAGLKNAVVAQTLMIRLGDQPQLTSTDILGLLTAYYFADPDKISYSVYQGDRGNPLVVPRSLRARLLEDPKNPDCRKFTRADADLVQELPLRRPGLLIDIHTPEAYQTLCPPMKEVAA